MPGNMSMTTTLDLKRNSERRQLLLALKRVRSTFDRGNTSRLLIIHMLTQVILTWICDLTVGTEILGLITFWLSSEECFSLKTLV